MKVKKKTAAEEASGSKRGVQIPKRQQLAQTNLPFGNGASPDVDHLSATHVTFMPQANMDMVSGR